MIDSDVELPTAVSDPLSVKPEHSASASALAWIGLATLVTVAFFAYADRQMIVLLTEPVRHSFSLSDVQIGLLTGVGLALFVGVAALPLGWVADRFDRRIVLSVCVMILSGAMIFCGLATNFNSLFLATICLGIAEAGVVPVSYGLIPDMFPERRRVLANAVFAMATIVGTGVGMTLGGACAHIVELVRNQLPAGLASMESWRLVFFTVAVPGPFLALLIICIRSHRLHDRGGSARERGANAPAPLARDYLRLEIGTIAGFFGAMGLINFGLSAILTWAPIIVSRNFGLSPSSVGAGIGNAIMGGSLIGMALSAISLKLLRKRNGAMAPLRACAYGSAVDAVLTGLFLLARTPAEIYLIVTAQMAALIAGSLLFPTIMQDISPAHLRSRVLALGVVVSVAVQSCSPVIAGVLSDGLAGHTRGTLWAMVATAACGFLAAGCLMFLSEKAVRRSMERYAGA